MPAIDTDSIEMIEKHVKKGVPRKFFLIYKGQQIKTLVIFKKGGYGPKIIQAKKAGFRGDVAYGVISGSGTKLFLQLPANGEVAAAMKVDSWEEKPPVKTAKLKNFLKENDLNFKPSFFMLKDATTVPDLESDEPRIGAPIGDEVVEDDHEDTANDLENAEQRYHQLATQIEPLIERVQKENPDKATAIVNVWVFAQQKAQDRSFDGANSALERLAPKLTEALNSAPQSDAERYGIESSAVAEGKAALLETFNKSKAVWQRSRRHVETELNKLEAAILDRYRDDDDLDEVRSNSNRLYAVLDDLDETLIANLDAASDATTDKQRLDHHRDAISTVDRYLSVLATNEFLMDVDSNPFTEVKIQGFLTTALNGLKKGLQQRLLAS